jgi:hypothetical protein
MRFRLRPVLATIVGFVAASAVMVAVESLNGRVLYPELGRLAEGMTDREAIRALFASAPAGALVVVLVGWVLGSAIGGYVAARIGQGARDRYGLTLGAIITLAGIANNLMVPPPVWFWIAGLVLPVPAALAGARAWRRRRSSAPPAA